MCSSDLFYLPAPPPSIPIFVPTPYEGDLYATTKDSLCTIVLPKKLTRLLDSTIAHKFKELIGYFESATPLRNMWVNHAFYELLMLCATMPLATSLKASSLSDQIADYIRNQLTSPFHTEALEQHFFLSYKYMAAQFKKDKSLTIGQYHTKLRMRLACELLSTTSLSITEISQELGFKDPLYFSRTFSKHMQLSPKTYRDTLPFMT